MKAKEMFEKLGYEQKIHTDKGDTYSNGIEYIKRDPESEIDRVGMRVTKVIEFYYHHKEILIADTYEHRSGKISKGNSGVLSLKELLAVQKQAEELGWL